MALDKGASLMRMVTSGGWAAKTGPGVLNDILKHLPRGLSDPRLLAGFDSAEDAAVFKINEDTALIQTVDFFPPMVDEPYAFGQIAAANALSDVYAMGAKPILALNLLAFPSDSMSSCDVAAILRGGADKVAEAGAIICGGHTIEDSQPKYGLSVTGTAHPDRVVYNRGARENDLIILTKPLGSGVLTTAMRQGLLEQTDKDALLSLMSQLNAAAAEAMAHFDVSACTDVTGFGLAGHAYEMAAASGASIAIFSNSLPLMPLALDFATKGYVPGGAARNRNYLKDSISLHKEVSQAYQSLIFDPQTSGGLLISLPEIQAMQLLRALSQSCPGSRVIGQVRKSGDKALYII